MNYQTDEIEDGFCKERTIVQTINDSFLNIKFIVFPCEEMLTNDYWNVLKKIINKDENWMLVTQLNCEPQNNEKLYEVIEEQLNKKGKRNRSRFVFISDNANENKEFIKTEFGVGNTIFIEDNTK